MVVFVCNTISGEAETRPQGLVVTFKPVRNLVSKQQSKTYNMEGREGWAEGGTEGKTDGQLLRSVADHLGPPAPES